MRSARRSELRTVQDVEELRMKLQHNPLAEVDVLGEIYVEVIDTLHAESGIRPAFGTKAK